MKTRKLTFLTLSLCLIFSPLKTQGEYSRKTKIIFGICGVITVTGLIQMKIDFEKEKKELKEKIEREEKEAKEYQQSNHTSSSRRPRSPEKKVSFKEGKPKRGEMKKDEEKLELGSKKDDQAITRSDTKDTNATIITMSSFGDDDKGGSNEGLLDMDHFNDDLETIKLLEEARKSEHLDGLAQNSIEGFSESEEEKNDREEIEEQLKNRAEAFINKWRPYHLGEAIRLKDLDLVRYFFGKKNKTLDQGMFEYSCLYSNLEIVKYLWSNRFSKLEVYIDPKEIETPAEANVNMIVNVTQKCIMNAIQGGHLDILNYLLSLSRSGLLGLEIHQDYVKNACMAPNSSVLEFLIKPIEEGGIGLSIDLECIETACLNTSLDVLEFIYDNRENFNYLSSQCLKKLTKEIKAKNVRSDRELALLSGKKNIKIVSYLDRIKVLEIILKDPKLNKKAMKLVKKLIYIGNNSVGIHERVLTANEVMLSAIKANNLAFLKSFLFDLNVCRCIRIGNYNPEEEDDGKKIRMRFHHKIYWVICRLKEDKDKKDMFVFFDKLFKDLLDLDYEENKEIIDCYAFWDFHKIYEFWHPGSAQRRQYKMAKKQINKSCQKGDLEFLKKILKSDFYMGSLAGGVYENLEELIKDNIPLANQSRCISVYRKREIVRYLENTRRWLKFESYKK